MPDIADTDPELLATLARLTQPVYTLAQLEGKPFERTKLETEINEGRLRSYLCDRRRLVDALEYARWLVGLRRRAADEAGEKRRRQFAKEIGTSIAAREGHRRARLTKAANRAAQQEAATA